jgi:CheY-like chemotaxis protein
MDPAKILIIEDDQFLSSVLKGRLEKEGFAVEQAFDGEEGLAKLKESRPDLILLDLILPKMSGFEVLEQISLDPQMSQIPVMIASNLGQESDIQKAKNLGAIEYYVKVKTTIDELAQMVKRIVEQGVGSMVQKPQEPQPPAQPLNGQ